MAPFSQILTHPKYWRQCACTRITALQRLNMAFVFAAAAVMLIATLVTQRMDTLLPPQRHHRGAKKVISISTFFFPFPRDDKNISAKVAAFNEFNHSDPELYLTRYSTPLVNVILNWRFLLPGWTVRIHVPMGYPLAKNLRILGADVHEHEFEPSRWCKAMTWRFLAEDDTSIDYWASRESESPPTFQDAAILKHWADSTEYSLHAIHNVGPHITWNGGLFGGKRGYLSGVLNSTLSDAIEEFAKEIDSSGQLFGSQYNDDQIFMSHIWKSGKVNTKVHGIAYESESVLASNRSFCFFNQCVPFPTSPTTEAEGFRPSMNTARQDEAILCHHRDPPYCRRHRFIRERVWLRLYELCTGLDFFTHEPAATQPTSALKSCPYKLQTSSGGDRY
jgi:hypothetical protein